MKQAEGMETNDVKKDSRGQMYPQIYKWVVESSHCDNDRDDYLLALGPSACLISQFTTESTLVDFNADMDTMSQGFSSK